MIAEWSEYLHCLMVM